MTPREQLILGLASARNTEDVAQVLLQARAAGLSEVDVAKTLGTTMGAWSDASSVFLAANPAMALKAQKAATASRKRFRRPHRMTIPIALQREIIAKFESEGRLCAICGLRVEYDEPVDVHHLTSWQYVHRRHEDPDRVENLAIAHRSCNQGWKISAREHAELEERFERYLSTVAPEQVDKLRRSVPHLFPGYKLAEFLNAKGF